MFDTVKEHLTAKTFGIVAYICSFIRFLCGLAFTGIAIDLKNKELTSLLVLFRLKEH